MQSWHLQREGACVSQTLSSTSCFPSSSRRWGGGASKQEDFISGNSRHADGSTAVGNFLTHHLIIVKQSPGAVTVGRFWDPESRYFILQSKTLNFPLTWTRHPRPHPPTAQILVAFPAFAARRSSGRQVGSDVVASGRKPVPMPCSRVGVSTCEL